MERRYTRRKDLASFKPMNAKGTFVRRGWSGSNPQAFGTRAERTIHHTTRLLTQLARTWPEAHIGRAVPQISFAQTTDAKHTHVIVAPAHHAPAGHQRAGEGHARCYGGGDDAWQRAQRNPKPGLSSYQGPSEN
jgi:hypothetical protein